MDIKDMERPDQLTNREYYYKAVCLCNYFHINQENHSKAETCFTVCVCVSGVKMMKKTKNFVIFCIMQLFLSLSLNFLSQILK